MSKLMLLGMMPMLLRTAGADEGAGYGYGEDTDAKVSPFNFGLNSGVCFLKKFEWIPNGGKEGAEQEALEIIFEINGTERSYRQFPVTQAFGKNQEVITDPNAKEFKEAMSEFNARITHILHAFVEDAVIRQALARRISNFKEYCSIVRSLLPQTTPTIPLDIFMQYQWSLKGDQNITYLDISSKRKHGAFIVKHVKPVGGAWKEVRVENAQDSVQDALTYVDGAGNKHPFQRTGWFMNSNFAIQQKTNNSSSNNSEMEAAAAAAAASMNASGFEVIPEPTVASTW